MSDCRPILEDEVKFTLIFRPHHSKPATKDTNPKNWLGGNWAIQLTAQWAGFEARAYWPECSMAVEEDRFRTSPVFETLKTAAMQELNASIDITADIIDSLRR